MRQNEHPDPGHRTKRRRTSIALRKPRRLDRCAGGSADSREAAKRVHASAIIAMSDDRTVVVVDPRQLTALWIGLKRCFLRDSRIVSADSGVLRIRARSDHVNFHSFRATDAFRERESKVVS